MVFEKPPETSMISAFYNEDGSVAAGYADGHAEPRSATIKTPSETAMIRALYQEDGSVAAGFADGSAILLSADGSGVVCLEPSADDGDIVVVRSATRYVLSAWRDRAAEALAVRNAFAPTPFVCRRACAASKGRRGPDLARWTVEGGLANCGDSSSATAEACAHERLCLVRYDVALEREDRYDVAREASSTVERLVRAASADALAPLARAVAESAASNRSVEVALPLPAAAPAAAPSHVAVATAAERAAGATKATPAYEALSVALHGSYYAGRSLVEHAPGATFLALEDGTVEARLHAPGRFAPRSVLNAAAVVVASLHRKDCALLRADGGERALPLSALGSCVETATWLLPGGEARVAAAARGFEAFIVQLRRRSLERPAPPPRPRPRLDASPVHREADGDAALTFFADGRARLVSDAPPVVLEVDAAGATLKVLLEGEAFEAPARRPPRGLGPLAARLVDFRFLSSLSPDDRRHELATRRRREAAIRGAAASAGAMAVGLKGAPPPPPPRAPASPAAPFTPPSRRGPAAAPATARVHAALRSTSDFLADLRAR